MEYDLRRRGFQPKLGLAEKLLSSAAFLIGGGSVLLFALFLLFGCLNLVHLASDEPSTLIIDTALCLLFFIQHSVMIRRSFRRRFSRIVKEKYQGAVYSVVSGIALIALVVLWQGSGMVLLSPDGPIRWLWHSLYLVAIAGFIWGTRSLGSFDPLGTGAIKKGPNDNRSGNNQLAVDGAYRWMRHPLYTFVIVMIWSLPHLTADRLLLNILFTVWIVVGTRLEEKDLVAEFGPAYREYQQRVPMLIPKPPGKKTTLD